MKKNLRIVSAAAAALLAVAPVAASGVVAPAATVSADTVNATNSTSDYSHINLGGSDVTKYVANVNPSFTLNAALRKNNDNTNANAQAVAAGSLTGSVTANVGGVTATANLVNGNHGAANVKVTAVQGGTVIYDGTDADHVVSNFNAVVAGQKYSIVVNKVGFNFGANNAGKEVTLALPKNVDVKFSAAESGWTVGNDGKTLKGKLDNNGTVNNIQLTETVTAFDASNTNAVVFYNIATGQQVKSGNTMVLADYNGQLNVNSILQAINSNFTAFQRITTPNNSEQNGSENQNKFDNPKVVTTVDEIKDQLEKAGIKVNAADNFNAPHSFTVTVKAVSDINGKNAELPVTFTVANVADPVVPSQSKTIMHNAYFYDKDAKRVGTDKVTRYNTVTVATSTTTINGKAYYEVVENGKLSGKFINADNIDGTKRTLKHNAYVYRSSKKRANKVVLKKGETVTTYGGSYTFKNGKKYYKIGNDTKKTYVKVANFD